jgi:hypothetical protein
MTLVHEALAALHLIMELQQSHHVRSVAISGNQWQSVAIRGNPWQSVAISGNQWQSAHLQQSHHVRFRAWKVSDERLEHLLALALALLVHRQALCRGLLLHRCRWQSVAISGNQWQSAAISGNQRTCIESMSSSGSHTAVVASASTAYTPAMS